MGYLDTKLEYADVQYAAKDRHVFGRMGLAKRAMDVAISGLAIIFLMPLFLIVALGIKLTSKGAIFYKQDRLGFGGKHFKMFKFRSMHIDGDHKLEAVLKACPISKAHWDKYQKLENDPRITRIGHFLRKSSIDELPQLLNVFLGSMSIVGQRPLLPYQELPYGRENYTHYTRGRPGITGLWQVSGRNSLPFERRAELDTEYSENWSLVYDIKLLFKTIPVVLFPSGAF